MPTCADSISRTAGSGKPISSARTSGAPLLRSADLFGARTGGAKFDGADLRGAHVDANLWTAASLDKAQIELTQAIAYATANGLVVEPT